MTQYPFNEKIVTSRIRKSSFERSEKRDEFYSDRSRIIFSSSFRRLQQKAQVFSLEPNSNVRTRLMHSLEVSDIGRSLASEICSELFEKEILIDRDMIPIIVTIVENACLLHDIGNPPFGHFGEAAIKNWVSKNLSDYAFDAGIGQNELDKFQADFYEFDGNPQGLRTVLRLHCEKDEFSLNLTYPTILAMIKYACVAGSQEGTGKKKAGYFLTERKIIEGIHQDIGIDSNAKYLLSYIMEAADDIAYCMSDISDGIEKRLITLELFLREFRDYWALKNSGETIPVKISDKEELKENWIREHPGMPVPDEIANKELLFSEVSISWSKFLQEEASKIFINRFEDFWRGTPKDIFNGSIGEKVLDAIKQVTRKTLYRSSEAENIELSGYSVIYGLLEHYGKLLCLPRSKFELLLAGDESIKGEKLDLEWRIFHRLAPRLLKSYNYQIKDQKIRINGMSEDGFEWWIRVHLIMDQISGMTDGYALQMYHMFEGIIHV